MKKREFTAEYKAKIVVEMLKEEKVVSEIALREGISRTPLQNWKKEFLENASRVFSQSKLEKTSKREAGEALAREGTLMKKVGQLTIENNWLKKNLPNSLDQIGKLNQVSKNEELSVKRQCELLGVNRSSVYYTPKETSAEKKEREELIKARLDFWHTYQCYLGVRGLKSKLCEEDNLLVGRKLISRYMDEIGIYAISKAKFV